jgi:hypothetical protein
MRPFKSVAFKLSILTSFFILAVIGLMARWIDRGVEEGLIGEMRVRAEFFARSSREALFPKVDPFSLHFQVEQMLAEKAVTYASAASCRRWAPSTSPRRSWSARAGSARRAWASTAPRSSRRCAARAGASR